jgi:hypothetical protein
MKRFIVLLIFVGLPATQSLADLYSVNIGLDIVSNDITAGVDFFSGDNTGATITGPYYQTVTSSYWGVVGGYWVYLPFGGRYWVPEYGWIDLHFNVQYNGTSLTVGLDTASIFGGLDVQNAELFLDFEGLDGPDNPQVLIEGNPVSGFAFTAQAPVEGGPIGARTSGDASNAFLSLESYVSGVVTDNFFEITFHNLAPNLYGSPASFRIDGLNIQADVVVPVPGAALLGILGLACSGWRLRGKRS